MHLIEQSILEWTYLAEGLDLDLMIQSFICLACYCKKIKHVMIIEIGEIIIIKNKLNS